MSLRAGDYSLSNKNLLFSCLLLSCSIAVEAQSDEPLSDKWTYEQTNIQTYCGIAGFLGLSVNFICAWYFYNQGQKKLIVEHQNLKRDLIKRCKHLNKLSQKNNKPYQRLVAQCLSKSQGLHVVDIKEPSDLKN